MKQRILIILAVVLFFCLPAIVPAAHTIEELQNSTINLPKFGGRERNVLRMIIKSITQNHFLHPEITPAVGEEWYNAYFEALDSEKLYFTQKEIADNQQYISALSSVRSVDAALKFAGNMYIILLERQRERAIFTNNYFQQEPDFSADESLPVDSKNISWAQDMGELHHRWEMYAKDYLLSDMMSKEQKEADAAKAKEKAKENEDDANNADDEQDKKDDASTAQPEKDIRQRVIERLIDNYYMRMDFTSLELLEPFFNALCNIFDPHTCYMAPATVEDFNIHMSLSLHGIGATLSKTDSYITIIELVPGSPAERSGELHEGDRIVAVAQGNEEPVNVVDMPINRAVKMIRGEKGTKVRLTILPKNSSQEKEVILIRDEIKLEDEAVIGENLEIPTTDGTIKNVLKIYIPSFYIDFQGRMDGKQDYRSTTRDVEKIITDTLRKHPIDSIILDLRGNGGGSLDEAVNLPGLFLEIGNKMPVVQVSNTQKTEQYYTIGNGLLPYKPMIVLTDSGSASASEIVAAFMQDSKRALIMGDKSTHGKGTIQTISDLEPLSSTLRLTKQQDNGSIKITINKFYRISGGSTQLKGVIPDVILPSYFDCLETQERFSPNALEWDSIPSMMNLYPTFKPRWLNHIPELQEIATNSVNNSEDGQKYLEFIQELSNFKQIKTIPLNLEKRREFYQVSHKMDETLLEFLLLNSKKNKKKNGADTEKTTISDPVLDASMSVMAKMLEY